MFLRVNVPHYVNIRAKRACIFKRFLIFIFLEYRKLTAFVLLLGTRRQIKIKNHLKSASQRDIILERYSSALLGCQRKNQTFLKNTHRVWVHCLALLNKIYSLYSSPLCLQRWRGREWGC